MSKELLLKTTHVSLGFGINETEDYEIYLETPSGVVIIFVDDKQIPEYKNSEILARVFTDCVNMDTWQHSWHMNVRDFLDKDVRDKIREIILEKQAQRKSELDYLRKVERVLMAQKVYV